jgi:predicted nucleic acid-binding protein
VRFGRTRPPNQASNFWIPANERLSRSLSVHADRLLIDEWEGRAEAERRHLLVTGTLGVLAEAHQQNRLDFEVALARLRQTNFYLSAALIDGVRRQLLTGRGRP